MSGLENIVSSSWLRGAGLKEGRGYPDIAGTFEGKSLVVVASGRCVWDDLKEVNIFNSDVMAVNDVGMHLPCEIRHWFSMHGDQIPTWVQARSFRYKNYDGRLMTHSVNHPAHTQYTWPWPGHGTSGLNAIYTGLGLGYDHIQVCGMPLDDSGHYYDPPDEHPVIRYTGKHAWSNFNREAKESVWTNAVSKVFGGKVEFLSGRGVPWTTPAT